MISPLRVPGDAHHKGIEGLLSNEVAIRMRSEPKLHDDGSTELGVVCLIARSLVSKSPELSISISHNKPWTDPMANKELIQTLGLRLR